jgi:hypothetical protein
MRIVISRVEWGKGGGGVKVLSVLLLDCGKILASLNWLQEGFCGENFLH